MRLEILESIDNIDDVRNNVELSVMESMIGFIDKGVILMEYNNDSFDDFYFFQEATVSDDDSSYDDNANAKKKKKGIMDEVKKAEKKDSSKLISILKFIPRVVVAFVKSIVNKFKDSDIADSIKDFGKSLNKMTDTSKQSKVDQINDEFKGQFECYIDEKSGKVKFKKDGIDNDILMDISELADVSIDTMDLFDNIYKNFDPTNPSAMRSLITDCRKALKSDKSVKKFNLFEGGFHALGEIVGTCNSSAGIIEKLGDKIQYKFQQMYASEKLKDLPDDKRVEAFKNCEELTSLVTQLVSKATGGLNRFTKPFMKKIKFICDLKHGTDKNKTLEKEVVEDRIIETHLKDVDFEKLYPKAHGESQDNYEYRIRKIKSDRVKELCDKNEKLWNDTLRAIYGMTADDPSADKGNMKKLIAAKKKQHADEAREKEKAINK